MSLDLRDQLREYGDHYRSALPTVGVEEILTPRPAAPHKARVPTPYWRRGLVVAAAAAVAVTLIGGVALLIRSVGVGDAPVATQPPTPATEAPPTANSSAATTAPQTSAAPAEVPSQDSGWTAVEVNVSGAGGFIADIATRDSELVAVGVECSADCLGAAWVSIDGLTWERAIFDAEDSAANNTLEAVAPGGPGWVAIGLRQSESDGSEVAIWSSEDGRVWQRAPSIEEFSGISRVPLGVAATDSQVVAVGAGMDESGIFSRVWSSSDGLSWTMTAELRDAELLDIVAFDTGFLAIGNAVNDADSVVVAAWTSTDGTEWTQVLQEDEVFGGQSGTVAAGPDRVLMVGGMPDTAWISSDGVDWTRVESLTLPMETRAAVADDEGYVIVGRGGWWTSVDGITWAQSDEELFTDAGVGAIARAGPGLVAVGSQPGQIPTVWVWTSPTG